jgi:hypothetical protein
MSSAGVCICCSKPLNGCTRTNGNIRADLKHSLIRDLQKLGFVIASDVKSEQNMQLLHKVFSACRIANLEVVFGTLHGPEWRKLMKDDRRVAYHEQTGSTQNYNVTPPELAKYLDAVRERTGHSLDDMLNLFHAVCKRLRAEREANKKNKKRKQLAC